MAQKGLGYHLWVFRGWCITKTVLEYTNKLLTCAIVCLRSVLLCHRTADFRVNRFFQSSLNADQESWVSVGLVCLSKDVASCHFLINWLGCSIHSNFRHYWNAPESLAICSIMTFMSAGEWIIESNTNTSCKDIRTEVSSPLKKLIPCFSGCWVQHGFGGPHLLSIPCISEELVFASVTFPQISLHFHGHVIALPQPEINAPFVFWWRTS